MKTLGRLLLLALRNVNVDVVRVTIKVGIHVSGRTVDVRVQVTSRRIGMPVRMQYLLVWPVSVTVGMAVPVIVRV